MVVIPSSRVPSVYLNVRFQKISAIIRFYHNSQLGTCKIVVETVSTQLSYDRLPKVTCIMTLLCPNSTLISTITGVLLTKRCYCLHLYSMYLWYFWANLFVKILNCPLSWTGTDRSEQHRGCVYRQIWLYGLRTMMGRVFYGRKSVASAARPLKRWP